MLQFSHTLGRFLQIFYSSGFVHLLCNNFDKQYKNYSALEECNLSSLKEPYLLCETENSYLLENLITDHTQ